MEITDFSLDAFSLTGRRALVTGSDLPYPEGVAAAEVLKVGAGVGGAEENRRGLMAIILSSLVSAGYFMLAKTRLVAEAAEKSFRVGAGATGVGGRAGAGRGTRHSARLTAHVWQHV